MTDISKINELAAALDSSNAINPVAKRNSRANLGYRPKNPNTQWLSDYAKKVVSLGYAREGIENFGRSMKNLVETGDPKYLLDYVGPGAIGGVPGAVLQTAFHGSPHKFDKFSLDKIGTGEGAQAYGHGLYFAESPDVARTYQNTLSKYGEIRFSDGSRVNIPDLPYGSPERVAGQIWMSNPEFSEAKFALGNLDSRYLGASKDDVLKELEKLRDKGASLSGSLYTVDIPDEAVSKMLDWDRPLSEQSDEIKNIAKELGVDLDKAYSGKGGSGENLYKALSFKLGDDVMAKNPEAASQWLRSRGIPGIKYLDGSSRTAGQGTRNFVVFDDTLPKILKRE